MWCTVLHTGICIAMYTFVDGQWDYEVHNDLNFTIAVQNFDGVMNTISPCGVDDSRTLWACVCVHWEMWLSSMTKSSSKRHPLPPAAMYQCNRRRTQCDRSHIDGTQVMHIHIKTQLVGCIFLTGHDK